MDVELKAGKDALSILLLQGKPIGEPVMQYGPFVMNTKQEINEAFEDYQKRNLVAGLGLNTTKYMIEKKPVLRNMPMVLLT